MKPATSEGTASSTSGVDWAPPAEGDYALYAVIDPDDFVDEFNEFVFAGGARAIGRLLWKVGDVRLIDGLAVNGTARVIGWVSSVMRHIQTGYVYHYAFAMILGLFLLITFFLHR